MVLIPDPNTAYLDPFRRTGRRSSLHCFVADPLTGERYSPRPALRGAEGPGAPLLHGPCRHRLLRARARVLRLRRRAVRDQAEPAPSTRSTRSRAQWNTGARRGPEPRLQAADEGGLLPRPPDGPLQDLRSDMAANAGRRSGVPVELHHHEVASRWPGRDRHPLRHPPGDGRQAHHVQVRPEVDAWAAGKSLTFMPKPIFEDNGSGMHTHQSLWKGGEPLFYDEAGYAGLTTWPAGTSAASSTTRRPCWPSRTRRRTASSGSCPATRRR